MNNHYVGDLLSYSAAYHMHQELIELTKDLLSLLEALEQETKNEYFAASQVGY